MVMLRLFLELRDKWDLALGVVHVNHQLRGEESDADEEFVRAAAAAHRLPCYVKRVETLSFAHTSHLSKQQAARELRYDFFETSRLQAGMTSVATAHQADDNAETVLLNVLRGTGVRGLTGIPPRREAGAIIRPMLFARRHEIEQYAQKQGIAYRTDSSNESTEYRRNFLRKAVMPVLSAEVHPDIVGSLNRLASLMRQLEKRISMEVETRWGEIAQVDEQGRMTLAITLLVSKPLFLQQEIIVRCLRTLCQNVDADSVRAILDLCSHPTGHSVHLSRSVAAYRDRDHLVFVQAKASDLFHRQVNVGGRYTFERFQFSLTGPLPIPNVYSADRRTEYVDADRLSANLVVRSWKEGDWFVPLGMSTKKKLSDFFTDEKVPLFEKKTIPILESEGEIVWICGKRLDDRFKVTSRTQSVVRLEFTPLPFYH